MRLQFVNFAFMHYVSVEGISKAFGIKPLFNQISFNLEEGDKVALVARNGSGKSTLLKILAGLETPDEGKVWIRKGINIAYLGQEPVLQANKTVIENIFDHDHPILNAIKTYEALVNSGQEAPEIQIAEAVSRMDDLNGWEFDASIRQILGKLGIRDLQQQAKTLSGGQCKRLALAKVLIDTGFEHHNSLLILDEPTNHLDVKMIEWLEHYLSRERVTLLLVTHDRYFLDRVCSQIMELNNEKLYTYQGDYAQFLENKSSRQDAERAATDKARNLLRRELDWVRRQPKARTTKSKARIDAYEELKIKAAGGQEDRNIELQIKMTRLGGKVLELKKVNKAFKNKLILKGFDYTFKNGERIGIIGENGSGKTTFLNLLTGIVLPDSGKINVGETVVFGNYSQEGLLIREDMRIIEYVKGIAEHFPLADGGSLNASEFLDLFLFPPQQQYTNLSSLSGGEHRRLQLLTVLFRNPNFLVMDEPTNDLDLQTLGILEDFLQLFTGCIVIVSHDRYFMDRLVDHLLVFEGDGVIRDFPGNYSQYRESLNNQETNNKPAIPISPLPAIEEMPIISPRKLTYGEKLEMNLLEKDIASLEKEKTEVEEKMDSDNLPYEELQSLAIRLEVIFQLLDKKLMRWLELGARM